MRAQATRRPISRGYRSGLPAIAALAAACRHQPPSPIAAPTRPPVLREEAVQPIEQPQLEIVDLQETPTADKKMVTLTGTLRNRGTGTTKTLRVRVDAYNQDDAVVLSAEATPTTEIVPPGATVTFTLTMENRRDVAQYHVETLAR